VAETVRRPWLHTYAGRHVVRVQWHGVMCTEVIMKIAWFYQQRIHMYEPCLCLAAEFLRHATAMPAA